MVLVRFNREVRMPEESGEMAIDTPCEDRRALGAAHRSDRGRVGRHRPSPRDEGPWRHPPGDPAHRVVFFRDQQLDARARSPSPASSARSPTPPDASRQTRTPKSSTSTRSPAPRPPTGTPTSPSSSSRRLLGAARVVIPKSVRHTLANTVAAYRDLLPCSANSPSRFAPCTQRSGLRTSRRRCVKGSLSPSSSSTSQLRLDRL